MNQNTISWNRLVVWLRQLDALETTLARQPATSAYRLSQLSRIFNCSGAGDWISTIL
jgi:hypothetical protein